MTKTPIVKKPKAKKVSIETAYSNNPELVQRIVDAPMPASEIKDALFKYAAEQSLAEEKLAIALEAWSDPIIHRLICDFGYTGEYLRAARRHGLDCELTGPDGQKRNKNTKNTLWQFKSRASGIQEAENFPQVARDAWKSATKCNLSGSTLDGYFELDHRRGRHFYGNVNLTPNSTVEECKEVTQPLSMRANLKKREVCNKCQASKVRPNGPYTENQEFWYEGDKNLDPTIGCNGCFWAYPEKWNTALNEKLKAISITIV